MAEGLKVMALEGHGVAFLPHSAVKKELRARRLVTPRRAGMPGAGDDDGRARLPRKARGQGGAQGHAQALWAYLVANDGRQVTLSHVINILHNAPRNQHWR